VSPAIAKAHANFIPTCIAKILRGLRYQDGGQGGGVSGFAEREWMVNCVLNYGAEIGGLKLRIVGQNQLLADSCSKPSKDIRNCNAQAKDAGLTRPLSRFDCYATLFHGRLRSDHNPHGGGIHA